MRRPTRIIEQPVNWVVHIGVSTAGDMYFALNLLVSVVSAADLFSAIEAEHLTERRCSRLVAPSSRSCACERTCCERTRVVRTRLLYGRGDAVDNTSSEFSSLKMSFVNRDDKDPQETLFDGAHGRLTTQAS